MKISGHTIVISGSGGAILGGTIGGPVGALIGAVAGATVGLMTGDDTPRQEKDKPKVRKYTIEVTAKDGNVELMKEEEGCLF